MKLHLIVKRIANVKIAPTARKTDTKRRAPSDSANFLPTSDSTPGQRFTNVRILKNCVNFFVRTSQLIESVSLKFFRKNFRTNSVYLCANLRMVLGCRKSWNLRNCHGGFYRFAPIKTINRRFSQVI